MSIKWETTYISNDDNPATTIVVRATMIHDSGAVMNTTKIIDQKQLEEAEVGPAWMIWLKRQEIKDEFTELGLL